MVNTLDDMERNQASVSMQEATDEDIQAIGDGRLT